MAQKYFLRTSSDCVRDSAARSAAHDFSAISSSLSNVCFGKRGMTIMVIGDADLCMQLLVTCWVHENQIGERLIAAIYYPYFMVEMPTGFSCDRLAALRTYGVVLF
jgi:hypothetical protein